MKRLLLIAGVTLSVFSSQAQCNELFFSEYVEGAGNDKALEVFNPGINAVDLSNYRIVRYSNGSPVGTDSTNLTGTIAAYGTFVIANGQTTGTPSSPACDPSLQAMAQQLDQNYPAPTYMNGDDALVLVKISPYKIIDIFGKIGEQPNTAWSDVAPFTGTTGKWWTKDHTLQRKSTVHGGVMTNPSQFNVTLEWDSLPKGTWTGLGQHACNCNLSVAESAGNVVLKFMPQPVAAGSNLMIAGSASPAIIRIFALNGQLVHEFNVSNKEEFKTIAIPTGLLGLYMMEYKDVASGKSVFSKITIF